VRRAAALAAAAALISACGAAAPTHTQHELGGGRVAAWWDDDHGVPVVRVSVEPALAGYHTYALDYDRATTDGVGVPTQIELAGSWSVAGPITADQEVESLAYPRLGLVLPVYPSARVVFTVPARRGEATAGQASAAPTVVVLTFALCSASRCLRPVQGQEIAVEGDPPS
jgi:hypothetical protein